MSDIICRRCGEPWEDYYMRWDFHEEFGVDYGSEAVIIRNGREYDLSQQGVGRTMLIRGIGCDACNYGESAVDAEDQPDMMDVLRSVEDSTDGDEIFEAIESYL